jgi:predicted anti-sigma-YlaC factor YlaD
MTNLNCEYVREVYPDVLNGTAASSVVHDIRAHIASCDECRADIAVLDALHAHVVHVPAGMHERVRQAVLQPRSRWRLSRSEIAMAATLAGAIITGSVLMQSPQSVEQKPAARAVPAVAQPHQTLGTVGVEDAMLSGKSSLDDLSVEQLKKLLGEID